MRRRNSFLKSAAMLLFVFVFCVCATARPAHALDKRLKLAFKTGGYGAAAGFVIGAGTMALGLGDYRNMFMGASAGLYAGIALAAYIVASQPDKKKMAPRNPYAPRQPIDPDEDWKEDDDEEDFKDNLPPDYDSRNEPKSLKMRLQWGPASPYSAPKEVALWSPVLTLQF